MATLVLHPNADAALQAGACESVALRTWLLEGWAVLFSHPVDFVRCELEMDRWLAVIERAFSGSRIRPLALASDGRSSPSWIAQISPDTRQVLLPPRAAEEQRVDPGALALRAHLEALRLQRFVMVIDDTLCCRRTYAYTALAEVPSPLEFLGWADTVRSRSPSPAARNIRGSQVSRRLGARYS